jgi:hypothetical protein
VLPSRYETALLSVKRLLFLSYIFSDPQMLRLTKIGSMGDSNPEAEILCDHQSYSEFGSTHLEHKNAMPEKANM